MNTAGFAGSEAAAAVLARLAAPLPVRRAVTALVPAPDRDRTAHAGGRAWQVRHAGRFRRYGRPAPGVWTAETFGCPACGGKTGPWTVTCDWRVISLGCPCGVVTHEHSLTFSEVWLLPADV